MFRNFDNWDTYRDRAGNTLHGCVLFCVKDGTTPANIYDGDQVSLANPQFTDSMGRTQRQVFVNADVLAYFYKYIGDGTMASQDGIDPSDESKWSLQYTVESAAIDEKDVEGQAAMGVGTMDELRALYPTEVPQVGGAVIVCLHGYFEPGDKAPAWYIWDVNATGQDDNGSVIESDTGLAGRWVLVPPEEHVDSRHFGVFPQDSLDAEADHTTGITQLVNYCNTCSLRPSFNGSADKPYFIYDGLTVNSRNPIDVSANTRFVDKSNSTFFGNWNGEPHFENGLTSIRCKFARTSWNFKALANYEEVVIDSDTPKASFVNALVRVEHSTANKTFNNCTIVSSGKLAVNTFRNCRLTGAMFASGPITPDVDDSVQIDVDDFKDNITLYLKLRDQQTDNRYDMHLATVSGSWSRDGIYWTNAVFDGAMLQPATTVTLDNCYGTVELASDDDGVSVAITNCPAIIVEPDNHVYGAFAVENSAVQFSCSAVRCAGFVGTDSDLKGAVPMYVTGPFSLDNVTISNPVTLQGAFSAQYCTINGDIVQTQSPVLYSELQSCRLGAVYHFAGTTPGTIVQGKWTGNVGTVDQPIRFDRTNLAPSDSAHTYTYANNSGTFIPERAVFTRTLTVIVPNGTMRVPDDSVTYNFHDDMQLSLYTDNYYDDTNDYENGLGGTVQFFRLGTDGFDVAVDWRVDGTSADVNYCCDSILRAVPFPMKAKFSSGFDWKLNMRRAPNHQDENASSRTRIAVGLREGSWVGMTITGRFSAGQNP